MYQLLSVEVFYIAPGNVLVFFTKDILFFSVLHMKRRNVLKWTCIVKCKKKEKVWVIRQGLTGLTLLHICIIKISLTQGKHI